MAHLIWMKGTSKNRRERPECKAHGAQEPEYIFEYTRIPSTAQRSSRVAQQVFRGALKKKAAILGLVLLCTLVTGDRVWAQLKRPSQLLLTVIVSGTGRGSVESHPSGILCGFDCTELYPPGKTVGLLPIPAKGSVFLRWGGDCRGRESCTVAMTSARVVTAFFQSTRADDLDDDLEKINKVTPPVVAPFEKINEIPPSVVVPKEASPPEQPIPVDQTLTVITFGGGTVTSNVEGINCGTQCIETYPHGSTVELVASPLADAIFTGWGGACSGREKCVVILKDTTSVTAKFEFNPSLPPPPPPKKFLISVLILGSGIGTVTSVAPGIHCESDCTELYSPGTQVQLIATPSAGSVFAGWVGATSGDCPETSVTSATGQCSIVVQSATRITAKFDIAGMADVPEQPEPQQTTIEAIEAITTEAEPGPDTKPEPAPTTKPEFQLQQAPEPTSEPEVKSASESAPASASKTKPKSEQTPEPKVHLFSLEVTVSGGGVVMSTTDENIHCPDRCRITVPLENGRVITLIPSPDPGMIFDGWSGACSGRGQCNVTMETDITDVTVSVSAKFRGVPLLINIQGPEGVAVRITSTPAGINCPSDCTWEFPQGTLVRLMQNASPDFIVTWSGECEGEVNLCTLKMTSKKTITLRFNLPAVDYNIAGTGTGSVISEDPDAVPCGQGCLQFSKNRGVELRPVPDPGSVFERWDGDCTGPEACRLTMNGDKQVTALFTRVFELDLHLQSTGTRSGTVTGEGIDCQADCVYHFPPDTEITLHAVPAPQATFTGWSGLCPDNVLSCSFVLDSDKTVTLTFTSR